jgi:hypothetical protein
MSLSQNKYLYISLLSLLVTANEVVAEPYYAAQNTRIPINRESNIRTRYTRVRPNVRAVAPSPFGAPSAPIAAKPVTANPIVAQYQPLNFILPDRSKAEYIPKNYKAMSKSAQPAPPIALPPQPNYRLPTNYNVPKVAPASAVASTHNASSATKHGWNKYVPPEMRTVAAPTLLNIKPYTGYRVDNLDWNVAGPDIPKLSELKYETVGMAEIGLEADYTHRQGIFSGVYIEGKASYAKAFSGRHTDSDFMNRLEIFDEENKSTGEFADGVFEFSRTEGDSDDGSANNFSGAIGYEIWREDNQDYISWITPIIGYSYQTMDLTMTNGELMDPRGGVGADGKNYDVATDPPIINGTPFNGLNSSYNTKWKGPFAGFVSGFGKGKHQLMLKGQLSYNDFDAEATWNLRTDFRQPLSFTQEGQGFGFDLGADYYYNITESWGVFAGLNYKKIAIKDGTDIVYFSDGVTSSSQRLNEVNWSSQLYRIGARYNF